MRHDRSFTRSSKKILLKFSDTCSVSANGLCIGSPRLEGGRKAGISNMQEFFCTMLYMAFVLHVTRQSCVHVLCISLLDLC